MNVTCGNGDAEFSKDFRNAGNLIGSLPNETKSIADKFIKIGEQRERILESFLAENKGVLPSQVAQVVTPLPNGDVRWHLEIK
tara:strand:- start:197 stop:445 length:249 start_codon:yes stop_codon:yes gene_type:complete